MFIPMTHDHNRSLQNVTYVNNEHTVYYTFNTHYDICKLYISPIIATIAPKTWIKKLIKWIIYLLYQ